MHLNAARTRETTLALLYLIKSPTCQRSGGYRFNEGMLHDIDPQMEHILLNNARSDWSMSGGHAFVQTKSGHHGEEMLTGSKLLRFCQQFA
jgi:hypothetical protein